MPSAACVLSQKRSVEGRPDAQEEAVALHTMHAAKGLEWPIVVPVNTMTQIMAPENAVTNRATGRFYCAGSISPTRTQGRLQASCSEGTQGRHHTQAIGSMSAAAGSVRPGRSAAGPRP
jgi:exodeoxyribonuclease-5